MGSLWIDEYIELLKKQEVPSNPFTDWITNWMTDFTETLMEEEAKREVRFHNAIEELMDINTYISQNAAQRLSGQYAAQQVWRLETIVENSLTNIRDTILHDIHSAEDFVVNIIWDIWDEQVKAFQEVVQSVEYSILSQWNKLKQSIMSKFVKKKQELIQKEKEFLNPLKTQITSRLVGGNSPTILKTSVENFIHTTDHINSVSQFLRTNAEKYRWNLDNTFLLSTNFLFIVDFPPIGLVSPTSLAHQYLFNYFLPHRMNIDMKHPLYAFFVTIFNDYNLLRQELFKVPYLVKKVEGIPDWKSKVSQLTSPMKTKYNVLVESGKDFSSSKLTLSLFAITQRNLLNQVVYSNMLLWYVLQVLTTTPEGLTFYPQDYIYPSISLILLSGDLIPTLRIQLYDAILQSFSLSNANSLEYNTELSGNIKIDFNISFTYNEAYMSVLDITQLPFNINQ